MKKYLLSLAVAATAIGAVAFTTVDAASKANRLTYYYRFDGNANNELQFEDVSKWTQVASPAAAGCPATSSITCLVQINDVPTKQDLVDEIAAASDGAAFVSSITTQRKP